MGFLIMQMDFTYDDFRENYLHSSALIPVAPLNPLSIVDEVKLSRVIDKDKINARVRMTFNELEKRMGGDYFAEFERVQTIVKEYGALVFPAYKILFLMWSARTGCRCWIFTRVSAETIRYTNL